MTRAKPGTKKDYEKRLEARVRDLVLWRDGEKCIEADIDGSRCSQTLQWGHYWSRHQSAWLKLTLFTFVQCSAHNKLHYEGDQTMTAALTALFGDQWDWWIGMVNSERIAHAREIPRIDDLRVRLEVYDMLWEHRPRLHDVKSLIAAGYYG